MGKYTYFNKKDNCLYINSRQLLPNTAGMGWKDHCKAYDKAFGMSYQERLEAYANAECRREVEEQLKEHTGCIISEYCNA